MTLVARIRHTLWSRWWRKVLTIACLLVALYAALGFLALPAILQWQIPKQVATHTTGHASVQDIRFNPFTFDLQLSGFTLTSSANQPLVSFKKLDINANPAQLVTGALAFAWIRLYNPSINAAVDASGQLNFAQLARPSQKPRSRKNKSGSMPDIVINDLVVSNGKATYKDQSQSRNFRLALNSVNLKLHDFTTQPDDEGKYRFTATLGHGQSLAWHGTLGVAPLRSQGELSLQGLELAQFWPYIGQRFKVSLQHGQLGASGQYLLRQSNGHLQLRVTGGKLNLANLALVEKGADKPLVAVPKLDVDGINFDLAKRRLKIGTVSTQDGRIRAKLLKDGQVDLATLLKPIPQKVSGGKEPAKPLPTASVSSTGSASTVAPAPTPATSRSSPSPATMPRAQQSAAATSAEPPPPFVVSVDTLAIRGYGIDFTDASKNKPVEFKLQPINVTIKGYSTQNDKPIDLTADLGLNGGTLSASGQVALVPIKATLKFQLKGLPLSPFQPYVEPFARLRIEKGQLNVGGTLAYAAGKTKPEINFDGDASVEHLDVTNTLSKQSLARLGKLAVNGIHYASAPAGVKIKSVILDKAFAQFIIEPDHSTNISAVLASNKKARPSPHKAPSTRGGSSKPMPISIGEIKIRKSKLQFADHSMKPKVDVGIQALGGTIRNFSTHPGTTAHVDLKGEVGPYAPVSIKGTVNPLGKSLAGDIAVKFRNLALTSFSPYSGKFAGYKIKKGKANLTLHYKIHDGLMQGKNDVVLDQLTLGERVDSPTAVNLPLRLALALLRDSHGVIRLNLPVHGDLNNPQFAIGPLIWKVFVNVLTKAVTSPFHLLAGLVSGSGDHLDHVDFAAGQSALSSQNQKALAKLADALKQRPSLELDLAGAVAPKLDHYVLAQQQLLAQIRGTQPQPDASTMLTADDQEKLLKLYSSKFGESAETKVERKQQESDAAYHQRVVNAAYKRLLANISIPDTALEQLAQARAEAVRAYLAKQGGLDPSRIFMLSPDLKAKAQGETVRMPLQLKVH